MRVLFLAIASIVLVCEGQLFAKTASCPCNPCPCAPCTCGGTGGGKTSKSTTSKSSTEKTGKGESYHKGKDRHDEHGSHVGVGVGVNIDLGGIGQRRAEPDPFAVGGPQPVARTQEKREKPKTKEKQHDITTPNPFSNVELTGPEAKAESAPPGPVNVSDEREVEQPTLPPTDVFTKQKPKEFTMDDLQKAKDAYKTMEKKFLDGDPDYQAALKQFKTYVSIAKQNSPEEKKVQEAFKKMQQRKDHFAQSDDGKKLFDDWMNAYQSVNKPGTDMPDALVPPNKLEQAKHDVAKAQNALNNEREIYDAWKNDTVTKHNGVKNIQSEIDALKKKPHLSEKDAQADRDKLKQLQAELDNAKKQVAKEWAATDEAKNQMKKIVEAEKELEKAKEAYKPFEQFEEKPAKAASNP
jgi:hypothetical protein